MPVFTKLNVCCWNSAAGFSSPDVSARPIFGGVGRCKLKSQQLLASRDLDGRRNTSASHVGAPLMNEPRQLFEGRPRRAFMRSAVLNMSMGDNVSVLQTQSFHITKNETWAFVPKRATCRRLLSSW